MVTAQRREASFTSPARGGTLDGREAAEAETILMVAALAVLLSAKEKTWVNNPRYAC